ncbi:MAG: hypothetical protein NZ108_02470, partial [Bacteroidia bacterium]|nr:hypothetical protein [Bacteroidia bacterium]
FWNIDPGAGNGSPLIAFDGSFNEAFEAAFANGVAVPGLGTHKIGVRVRGADGSWSSVFYQVVTVENSLPGGPNLNITQGEFFIDTDPGPGNATPLVAFDGGFDEAFEAALATVSVPVGMHKIGVRMRGQDGTWSATFFHVISVENPLPGGPNLNITQAEYFVDSDPGVGNGIPLLAFDGGFDEAFEAALTTANVPVGMHKIGVRMRGQDGTWSATFFQIISVETPLPAGPNLNITQLEYFWDSDPGPGNGTPLLAFDGSFDEALEAAFQTMSLPPAGIHKLSVRARGSDGTWSAPFSQIISIENPLTATRPLSITAAEYFWDSDPGPGNGTPVFATDGTFDESFEKLVRYASTAGLTTGFHKLFIRTRGGDNSWGIPFAYTILISPCPTLPEPNITAGGPTTFCLGGNVTLDAGAGFVSYEWTDGFSIVSTSRTYTASATANYSVTVTDANGCLGADTTSVTVIPPPSPVITAGGSTTICPGSSVTLDAGAGYSSYLWSNGATTRTINASSPASYTVTVSTSCGSGTSDPVTVNLHPAPNPTITAGGPTTFCQGDSVLLSTQSFVSYSWSNGANTQSQFVRNPGNYTVTVTDGNGCQGTSPGTLVTVHNPTITPSGPTTFCAGGSVTLTAPDGYSYLWNTGATSRSITVTSSGSYHVTVTSGISCTSSPVVVTVNPRPDAIITPSGPTTFCEGGSVTLNANLGETYYQWYDGFDTYYGTSIVVSSTSNWQLTVGNGFGCYRTSPVTSVVEHDNPAPIITPSGPTTFCAGGSVLLSTTSYVSYDWKRNGTTVSTASSFTANTAGNYTVTVVDGNGCTGISANTPVTVNTVPLDTVHVRGATTFCQGDTVFLTAAAGTSWLWSNGDTTQQIAVLTSGVYTCNVTNACGTTTSVSTNVTVHPSPNPIVTPNRSTNLCPPEVVTLDAPPGYVSYLWSNGATTEDITTGSIATYSVTVTDGNGCSGTSTPIAVTRATVAKPVLIRTLPTDTICSNQVQIVETAQPYDAYLWHDMTTSDTFRVVNSGPHYVRVDSSGCQAYSDTIHFHILPAPEPQVLSGGPTTICQGDSVQLFTEFPYPYIAWNRNNVPWAIGDSLWVSTSHAFSATVQAANGCYATTPNILITVLGTPTPVISPSGPITICENQPVTLDAGVYSSYLWSNGEVTRTITTNVPGFYTVTVSEGCAPGTSAAVEVIVLPTPPPPLSTDRSVSLCPGDSVTITAYSGISYLWNTGATTASIKVGSAGTYIVTAQLANGCSAQNDTVVILNSPTTPTITPSGPTTFCSGNSVTLTATTGTAYLWNTGATTQSIIVNTSG